MSQDHFVKRHPKKILLAFTLFCAFLISGVTKYKERYDFRIWFVEGDKDLEALDYFEEQFGNDERVTFILKFDEGVFTKRNLKIVSDLTEKTWTIPQIVRADSISNAVLSKGSGDDLEVAPLYEVDDLSDYSEKDLEKLENKILGEKSFANRIVSLDGKTTMVSGLLIPSVVENPDYKKIVEKAREFKKEFEALGGLKVYVMGAAAVNDAFREVSESDVAKVIPLMCLLIIVILYWFTRSALATVVTLSLVLLSLGMTFGLTFLLGIAFNSILAALPGVIMSIGIADSVHVWASFYQSMGTGLKQHEAANFSLRKNFIPTILTTISTSIGFGSLVFADIVPIRELGIIAAIGCFIAWIATYGFLGPILYLAKFKVPERFCEEKKRKGLSSKLNQFCKKHDLAIVIFFALLVTTSTVLTFSNKVNSNPFGYFTEKIPLIQAQNVVDQHYRGTIGPEILIKSSEEEGSAQEPEFLSKVESFLTWLEEQEYTVATYDLLDVIKNLRQGLRGGEKKEYRVPETRQEVAQILFLYEMSLPPGVEVNNLINLEKNELRIKLIWEYYSTQKWVKHCPEIEAKAKELGLDAKITGKFYIFQNLMGYIVKTFFSSIAMALVLVVILMMILFKSISLGLLSLLPNIIPVLIGGGVMWVAGMDLNLGTSLVASVCLGIAVDDTIHFLANYQKARKGGKGIEQSIEEVLGKTGEALVVTTIILTLGFALFLIGDFIPNVQFGILSSVVLTFALIVDLLFLPALLYLGGRLRAKKKAT